MYIRRHSRFVALLAGFATSLFAINLRAQDGGDAGAPDNDDCRDLIDVPVGNTPFDTEGGSTDGPEEFSACFFAAYPDIFHDVWFRHTATCNGELKVNLCESDFDTKVAVYSGGACPVTSPPLGCNDDDDACALPGRSELIVPVTQGNQYIIRVGGYVGQSGAGVMKLSCNTVIPMGACCNSVGTCLGTISEPACNAQSGVWHAGQNCSTFVCPIPPPANDECETCIPLTTGQNYDGTSFGATGSFSTCSLNDTKDVWHCWTATCTGRARIATCGSSFDTSLAVYDACSGNQLACNDDGCTTQSLRSQILIDVIQGNTYKIRVAGRQNATGNYRVTVDPCRNACCINGGFTCQVIPESQCTSGGGSPGGPGSLCEGDSNQNGIDDVCENGCPTATINGAEPANGTLDARQPSPMNSPAVKQGIGAAGAAGVTAEPIYIQLSPALPGAENCFELCETAPDPQLGANDISSVVYQGGGVYRLTLLRPITTGASTTIEYTGNGSFVRYFAHPANVNNDGAAAPTDILTLIDNLNGVLVPALSPYHCDLNRSGVCNPADILTLVDLLNGAGAWDPWNGTQRPGTAGCP